MKKKFFFGFAVIMIIAFAAIGFLQSNISNNNEVNLAELCKIPDASAELANPYYGIWILTYNVNDRTFSCTVGGTDVCVCW